MSILLGLELGDYIYQAMVTFLFIYFCHKSNNERQRNRSIVVAIVTPIFFHVTGLPEITAIPFAMWIVTSLGIYKKEKVVLLGGYKLN